MQHLNNLKNLLLFNKLFVFLTIFSFFYVLLFTVIIKYDSIFTGNENNIQGKVKSLSLNGNKLKLEVCLDECIIANYYIETKKEKDEILDIIKIGSIISLNGSLYKASNNTIPNNFNYKKYLYNNKIYYLMNIDSFKILKDGNWLDNIKDKMLKRAYKLDNSDYLLVLILGDKSLVSSNDYNNYLINGTAHLLAISGAHIGVIIKVFSFLFSRFNKYTKIILLSFLLLFFGFITGFQASICRAIFFFIFSNINKLLKLNYSNIHILLFVAFFLIIFNPFIVYNLGFLYSFAICFGIFY